MEPIHQTRFGELYQGDCLDLMKRMDAGSVDLIFADPPYNKGMGEKALASLVEGGWLAPNAIVVLEESAAAEIIAPAELSNFDRRVYGDTQVSFYRYRRPNSLSMSASLSAT